MSKIQLLISGGWVIDPIQKINEPRDLLITGGLIEAIGNPGEFDSIDLPDELRIDANGAIVSPGFLDMHCHLREPGFEHKETIESGTQAAAAGGFTTVCAMPNTDPAMDSVASVKFLVEKARGVGQIRVLPIAAITRGRAGLELTDMSELAEAGAVGFSDDGDPVSDGYVMRHALAYSSLLGLPIINHSEDRTIAPGGVMNYGFSSERLGLVGIPSAAEEAMVSRDIALAELTRGILHLAHVSTERSVDLVRAAKQRGVNVTAEVTPHHLVLTDDWVTGEATELRPHVISYEYDTNTKVSPPLRSGKDVQCLQQALDSRVVEVIATDHAPHATVDKLCSYDDAAFGISGLETALSMLVYLHDRSGVSFETIIRSLTEAPAKIIGREDLGSLREGTQADITIFNPNLQWKVDSKQFLSKGKNSPLDGVEVRGRVLKTIYSGNVVFSL